MPIVLVNPNTKKPTVFAPADNDPYIYTGPYQNVAYVTQEWLDCEREYVNRPTPSDQNLFNPNNRNSL